MFLPYFIIIYSSLTEKNKETYTFASLLLFIFQLFFGNPGEMPGIWISSTSKNKYLAISRRIIFQIQSSFSTAQRWLRLETLTQQLENQTGDMAGYLIFDVLEYWLFNL